MLIEKTDSQITNPIGSMYGIFTNIYQNLPTFFKMGFQTSVPWILYGNVRNLFQLRPSFLLLVDGISESTSIVSEAVRVYFSGWVFVPIACQQIPIADLNLDKNGFNFFWEGVLLNFLVGIQISFIFMTSMGEGCYKRHLYYRLIDQYGARHYDHRVLLYPLNIPIPKITIVHEIGP